MQEVKLTELCVAERSMLLFGGGERIHSGHIRGPLLRLRPTRLRCHRRPLTYFGGLLYAAVR